MALQALIPAMDYSSKSRNDRREKREAGGKEKETEKEKKKKNERVLQLQTETQKIHDQAEVLLAAVTKEPGMSLWHLA